MLIKSMAGDFEISIDRFETEDGYLVMTGKMGVWDARTYITPRELLAVFGKLLRLQVIFYVLLVPFRVFSTKESGPTTQ